MTKAIWNGAVLAESNETVMVEGNHYFPPDAINREYFTASDKQTTCPWKGLASYYAIEVDGATNKDAGLVLSGTKRSGQPDQGLRGLLARR